MLREILGEVWKSYIPVDSIAYILSRTLKTVFLFQNTTRLRRI